MLKKQCQDCRHFEHRGRHRLICTMRTDRGDRIARITFCGHAVPHESLHHLRIKNRKEK